MPLLTQVNQIGQFPIIRQEKPEVERVDKQSLTTNYSIYSSHNASLITKQKHALKWVTISYLTPSFRLEYFCSNSFMIRKCQLGDNERIYFIINVESFWPIVNTERLQVKYVEEKLQKILELASRAAYFAEGHILQNYRKCQLRHWKTIAMLVLNDAGSKVNAIRILLCLAIRAMFQSSIRQLDDGR